MALTKTQKAQLRAMKRAFPECTVELAQDENHIFLIRLLSGVSISDSLRNLAIIAGSLTVTLNR